MKKYLILGIAAFSLMATTVYALNGNNNFVNGAAHNQNCPYHNSNENCPYYDETISTHNYQNSESGNCHHNNCGSKDGYGRQGRHHHNR